MIIGVDFDNTIVCYDALFHRVAVEKGLIPADTPPNKTAVRDYLRAAGKEDLWTALQGEVYGSRIEEAQPYPGVIDFFIACRAHAIPLRIISHKTRFPYLGEKHDLHEAARRWLRVNGFFDASRIGMADGEVIFELTKEAKLARIGTEQCTHFIDDLPELLSAPQFPVGVERFLFDPESLHQEKTTLRPCLSWAHLRELLCEEHAERAVLASLCRTLSLPSALPLVRLSGGANNRVYRLGEAHVLKRYFVHPGDQRDRYTAEKAFYAYAAYAAKEFVPAALHWDDASRTAAFAFIDGFRPQEADTRAFRQAMAFLSALNREEARELATSLPLASEACLSYESHSRTVAKRIDRLLHLPVRDSLDEQAANFVSDTLMPSFTTHWDQLHRRHAGPDYSREIGRDERCISPSDFGFHNALRRSDGSLVFLDFEYAGWDDPAKLICDFFCQPEVPVPLGFLEECITTLSSALGHGDPAALTIRCQTLLPLYRIKWSCILLNEFTVEGRSRREYALGKTEAAVRRQRQLNRARSVPTLLPQHL